MDEKHRLRGDLRRRRSEFVAALPDATRGLLFLRPPAPVVALVPEGACVGLYHASGSEAPALSYAKWFHEHGRTLALPWFAVRGSAMQFRVWRDPYAGAELDEGPYGLLQPRANAREAAPQAAFIPVIGFTAGCDRLGQGGGHYDRWLAANPKAVAIGLAWDCQLTDVLPVEAHDKRLRAVVTPTRIYEEEG